MTENNKHRPLPHHFTLHLKKPGGLYQACFCYRGEVKWLGTGELNQKQAFRKAKEAEPDILKELARQAALKGEERISTVAPGTAAPAVPPLDLTKPAPQGSFRQGIEAQLNSVLAANNSVLAERGAVTARKHLYDVFGGYVDLAITNMDVSLGARLADFYIHSARFKFSGVFHARQMRRFLRPMAAYGLPGEFIAALDKVEDREEQRQPVRRFTAQESRRIKRRLEVSLARQFMTGSSDRRLVEICALLDLWLLVQVASKQQ